MARPASVFASSKDQDQRNALLKLWKEQPNHFTRMRGHAILLSDDGFEIELLVQIFGVHRDTVRSWIAGFQEQGIEGLLDDDRPDGPRKLNENEQETLKTLLRLYPSRPAKVMAELRAQTGKTICRDSLRRYAKLFHLSWHRFRRSLRKKRGEMAFRLAKEELAELLE